MQQLSPDLDPEEASGFRQQGSPPDNSPSGCFGTLLGWFIYLSQVWSCFKKPCAWLHLFSGPVQPGATASGGLDNGAIVGLHSAVRAPIDPFLETAFHGISSSLPHSLSSPVRAASVSNHNSQTGLGELSHSLGHMNFGFQSMPIFHPHSLPEYHHESISSGVAYNSPGGMSTIAASMSSRPAEGNDSRHIPGVGSGGLNSRSFELNDSGERKKNLVVFWVLLIEGFFFFVSLYFSLSPLNVTIQVIAWSQDRPS